MGRVCQLVIHRAVQERRRQSVPVRVRATRADDIEATAEGLGEVEKFVDARRMNDDEWVGRRWPSHKKSLRSVAKGEPLVSGGGRRARRAGKVRVNAGGDHRS